MTTQTKSNRPRTTFDAWMKLVDQNLITRTGLDSSCLADQPYRDWFETGVNPKSAASKAIRYNQD